MLRTRNVLIALTLFAFCGVGIVDAQVAAPLTASSLTEGLASDDLLTVLAELWLRGIDEHDSIEIAVSDHIVEARAKTRTPSRLDGAPVDRWTRPKATAAQSDGDDEAMPMDGYEVHVLCIRVFGKVIGCVSWMTTP